MRRISNAPRDASNINSITDGVTANLSQAFQYDLVGRVTQGVGPYGTENYTYDALGNRLTRSVINGGTTTTTYTYGSSNTRLTSATTGSQTLNYSYDANGARITTKLGNQTQASYTYNADARLAASGTNSFKYNGFGERSVATVTGGGTHFIFADDGKPLAEHGTSGALIRNYIYLNGQPFALVDGAGTVSTMLNDQVGQPQKMLDGAGNLTWHRVAGIFGNTVSQPVGSTAANPQRFPGQQYDPNIALHYNYFRTYDPATGRYLEADPIGLAGGMNLYAYAEADSVNNIDPTGEIVPIAPIVAGGIIGGGLEYLTNDCASASDIILAGALDGIGGGIGGATVLRYGPRSLTRVTGKEWSHSIPKKVAKLIPNKQVQKVLNKRGGLNGSWVTPKRHYKHDASRFPEGYKDWEDKLETPIGALDRIPDWMKISGGSGAAGAGAAGGGDCGC